MSNLTTRQQVGQFGIFRDNAPVVLRPIKALSTDLRDPKRMHLAEAMLRRLRVRWRRG